MMLAPRLAAKSRKNLRLLALYRSYRIAANIVQHFQQVFDCAVLDGDAPPVGSDFEQAVPDVGVDSVFGELFAVGSAIFACFWVDWHWVAPR